MKKVKVKVLQGDEQQIEKDLVLKKGKVYVPKDEKLRVEIIHLHYDELVAEYRGRQKTTELVIKNYQQSRVTIDVGKYVDKCNICQRMKNRTKALMKKLKLSEISEKLWTYLMMNFITKLPLVAVKNAILVVYNRLSKMTHFVTTIEMISVERLVQLFRNNV